MTHAPTKLSSLLMLRQLDSYLIASRLLGRKASNGHSYSFTHEDACDVPDRIFHLTSLVFICSCLPDKHNVRAPKNLLDT